MTDKQLSEQLRKLKINTKSIACLGCGHENGCSVHGCNLIGMAADRISEYEQLVETVKAMHTAASGVGKSLLRDVLDLFDPEYGKPPCIPRIVINDPAHKNRNDPVDALAYAFRVSKPSSRIIDFKLCADTSELAKTLRCIDDNGYFMIGVTQDASGVYTVFFRRPARE